MLEQPCLIPINEKEYILEEDYIYVTSKGDTLIGHELRLIVPKGTVTDIASVPRICWSIIPKDGLHRGAAVVHDYLYQRRGFVDGYEFSRKDCDLIFKEMMLKAGCNPVKVQTMYLAVRAFGWLAW